LSCISNDSSPKKEHVIIYFVNAFDSIIKKLKMLSCYQTTAFFFIWMVHEPSCLLNECHG